jgi:hypothetical protein
MKRHPSSGDKPDPERFLKDTANAFFFDPQSGIHQPKAYQSKNENDKQSSSGDPAWRFWVTTILSTLTLITVGIYAYYAALQWYEMKRTADASKQAADAAGSAATTAADSANLNRQLAEGTQAALISFEVQNGYIGLHELGFKIYFSNVGHVAAQEFTADVTIIKETMMEHTPIGKPIHWRIPKTTVRTGEFGNGPNKDVTIDFDTERANRFEQTIKVEAEFSYDNGFARRVPEKSCKSFVSGVGTNGLASVGFVPCQDADAYVKRAMNAKQAADKNTRK